MKKRFTEEQIIRILKERETGCLVDDICRLHSITNSTFYKWKAKFGSMEVNEAKRLGELERENSKIKCLLAEAMLDNAALKDVVSKKS